VKIINSILSISLIFLINSCAEQEEIKEWTIQDLSKQEQRIALLMEEKPKGLQLKVKAEVDGNFKILLRGSDSGHYRQIDFNEKYIDTIYTQEWYSPNCTTIYLPGSARTGSVNIEVKLLPNPTK
jgi:hypothetical protein